MLSCYSLCKKDFRRVIPEYCFLKSNYRWKIELFPYSNNMSKVKHLILYSNAKEIYIYFFYLKELIRFLQKVITFFLSF